MAKLDQYYNRYDAGQNYETVMYRADRVLQSAELNEVQSITSARITAIADSILLDGDIIQGAQAEINLAIAAAICEAGAIYVRGAVRSVPPAVVPVPLDGTVSLGVYLKEIIVTELENPDLYNPAKGSRAEGEPGAARLKVELAWGLGSNAPDYYALYTITDGVITANRQPPMLLRGLGNDGDVLTTRDNSLAWEPPGFGWGGGGKGSPDLSGLECRVPERVTAGESDYVSFSGVVDPAGGKVLLSIDPLLSGLVFAQTQGIAQGAEIVFTAPSVPADKEVVFRLEAMSETGLTSYMLFTLTVVASLDLSKMVAVVPAQILATQSDTVKFSGITDPNGKTVTLALDPLDSGLVFAKTTGIALATAVTVTAPSLQTGKRVKFKMTASSAGGLSVSRVYELDVLVIVPELSNLVSRVPASIPSKKTDYVSFGKSTDAQAATMTLSLDPLSSGLVFAKSANIALGEQVTVTAPALSAGKQVTFAVTAKSTTGITATANFVTTVTIGAPDMSAIKATIPASLVATKSGTVSFTGVTDPQGLALTLSLGVLSSGLTFSKSTGIALGAAVTVTAPDITAGKKVKFSVTAANSAGVTATAEYEIEITVSAPNISAMVVTCPASIVATQSGTLSVTGVTDPQGWPVTITLEPPTDLTCSKTTGITLAEQIKLTAVDMLYNKVVSLKVNATNKSGKVASKTCSVTIIGATLPSMQTFSHTVPAAIMRQTTKSISFAGALGGNNHAVTYRIDKGSSGLSFAKVSGIVSNEWVVMTAPYTALPTLATTIKVCAVDSVTGKESAVTLSITILGQDKWAYTVAGVYAWTAPVTGRYAIKVVGAGAGGSSGVNTHTGLGGAAGGGGTVAETTLTLQSGSAHVCTSGKCGAGGVSSYSTKGIVTGTNGGTSSFASQLSAVGGAANAVVATDCGGAGGLGAGNSAGSKGGTGAPATGANGSNGVGGGGGGGGAAYGGTGGAGGAGGGGAWGVLSGSSGGSGGSGTPQVYVGVPGADGAGSPGGGGGGGGYTYGATGGPGGTGGKGGGGAGGGGGGGYYGGGTGRSGSGGDGGDGYVQIQYVGV